MKTFLAICISLLLPLQAAAADAPKVYGKKGYVWDEMTPERIQVLKTGGDPVKGKEAFRGCRGCHKADAAGTIDGTYPRLSGQHLSVLVKQITEIRAGIRHNPKMLPFVEDPAIAVDEIGDIAAFLSSVESYRENGKGQGDMTVFGMALYEKNKCYQCHGKSGEGNADKAFPALAAQHYNYLLREMRLIESGARGNSHPEMVKAIAKFKQSDLEAVADYLSRLPDYRSVDTQGAKK